METEKPLEVPLHAVLVRAAGQVATVSLSDEYASASLERRMVFASELQKLDEAERQSVIDDHNVRL